MATLNIKEGKALYFEEGMDIRFEGDFNTNDMYVFRDDKDNRLYLLNLRDSYKKFLLIDVTGEEIDNVIKRRGLRVTKLEPKELQYCLNRNDLLTMFKTDELVGYKGEIYYIKEGFKVVSSDKNYRQNKEVYIVKGDKELKVKVKDIIKSNTEDYATILYNQYKNPETKVGVMLALNKDTELQHKFNVLELRDKLKGSVEDVYRYAVKHVLKNGETIRLNGEEVEGLVYVDNYNYQVQRMYQVSEGIIQIVKTRRVTRISDNIHFDEIEEYKISITPDELFKGLGISKYKGLGECLEILAEEDYFKLKSISNKEVPNKFNKLESILGDILQTKEGRESNELRTILQENHKPSFEAHILSKRTVIGLANNGYELEINGKDSNLLLTIRSNIDTETIQTNKEELKNFFQTYYSKVKGEQLGEGVALRYTDNLIIKYLVGINMGMDIGF